MKKLLLLLVLLLTISTQAQITKTNIGINYGYANTIGVNLSFDTDDNFVVGAGASVSLSSSGIGNNYNNKNYTNNFLNQIMYDKVNKQNDYSIYLLAGYKINHFKLVSKLGYGGLVNYKNYYDPNRLFGDGGYYYKTETATPTILAGGYIEIETITNVNLNVGYDNFNKTTLGLTYTF